MSKEKEKKPLVKKPLDEEHMQIKYIGNAPLWKIFASLITIPTVLISTAYLLLQNDGGEYKVTHKVFFDVEIAGVQQPRMVFGLFGETVPRTVQNFLTLATDGYDGHKYQGSQFHRVIKQFMLQGGDVVSNDGQGSISIYGPMFPDENFLAKHTGPGYISMANSGPDSNGCQFYITLIATHYLDNKHVVFGKVIEGEETLTAIEYVETDWDMKPFQSVTIAKSGSLKVEKPFMVSNDPYNFKDWAMTTVPALLLVTIMVYGFDRVSKMLDRGINMHENIIRELEEKEAKELAEAAAAGGEKEAEGDAEVVKGREEEDKENVRKRHVE